MFWAVAEPRKFVNVRVRYYLLCEKNFLFHLFQLAQPFVHQSFWGFQGMHFLPLLAAILTQIYRISAIKLSN